MARAVVVGGKVNRGVGGQIAALDDAGGNNGQIARVKSNHHGFARCQVDAGGGGVTFGEVKSVFHIGMRAMEDGVAAAFLSACQKAFLSAVFNLLQIDQLGVACLPVARVNRDDQFVPPFVTIDADACHGGYILDAFALQIGMRQIGSGEGFGIAPNGMRQSGGGLMAHMVIHCPNFVLRGAFSGDSGALLGAGGDVGFFGAVTVVASLLKQRGNGDAACFRLGGFPSGFGNTSLVVVALS